MVAKKRRKLKLSYAIYKKRINVKPSAVISPRSVVSEGNANR